MAADPHRTQTIERFRRRLTYILFRIAQCRGQSRSGTLIVKVSQRFGSALAYEMTLVDERPAKDGDGAAITKNSQAAHGTVTYSPIRIAACVDEGRYRTRVTESRQHIGRRTSNPAGTMTHGRNQRNNRCRTAQCSQRARRGGQRPDTTGPEEHVPEPAPASECRKYPRPRAAISRIAGTESASAPSHAATITGASLRTSRRAAAKRIVTSGALSCSMTAGSSVLAGTGGRRLDDKGDAIVAHTSIPNRIASAIRGWDTRSGGENRAEPCRECLGPSGAQKQRYGGQTGKS